jgi:Yip1-like protein
MDLVARAKAILLTPKDEWVKIEQETTTPSQLFREYVIPLAAIGPVASIIGYSILGIGGPFMGTFRIPLGRSIASGVTSFVLALVAAYVGGLILNGLAPTFGAKQDPMQALKLSVYSSTAGWLAGIFALLPGLRVLGLLGLYSLYLLVVGVPIMMKSPPEKTGGYVVAAVVSWVVLAVLVQEIARQIAY